MPENPTEGERDGGPPTSPQPDTSDTPDAPDAPDTPATADTPDTVPSAGTPEPEPATPAPRPGRAWHRRPGVRPLAVGLLAGLLLGVGVPEAIDRARGDDSEHVSDASDVSFCWGALSVADLRDIHREERDEVAVTHGETPLDAGAAECRLLVGDDRKKHLTVTVGPIDHRDVEGAWAADFLRADLAPYAGTPEGLAGDTQGWVKLPPDCRPTQRDQEAHSRVVSVQVTGGSLRPTEEAVARATLKVANAALDGLDCHGRYATEGDLLTEAETPDTYRAGDEREFCGTGTASPEGLPTSLAGPVGGPVRVCSGHPNDPEAVFRIVTVEDPHLQEPFVFQARGGNHPLLELDCGGQTVRVMAQGRYLNRPAAEYAPIDLDELLHRYATAEAERLGCPPPA